MEHVFFSDGNQKQISWAILTGNDIEKQMRDHPENYFNKVTVEQAKYIALHAGIFWCIGRFIIKNEDAIKVKLDSKSMYDTLRENKETLDSFCNTKINFLNKLIEQRKLEVKYELISSQENAAKLS